METVQRSITPEQYSALFQPVRPPSPQELFEFERERLRDLGLASVDMFDGFANRLPESGPFILVPPQPAAVSELNWNELMARIEFSGKTGVNYLTPKYLTDLAEPPAVPTMLTNVEDGRARRNTKPSVSRENIAREGRFDYSVWRGYIHAVLFPDVLQHHYMDLVGSRFMSGDVPFLYLSDDGPALRSSWEDDASEEWGAPSCESIETLEV